MSKTIWKYALPRDGQTIEIHEHIVKVLHIAAQDGVPTLWAIVDPDRPRDGYTEVVAWGTGWPVDEIYYETDYWGTCEDGYGYIWHYFAAARYPERNDWTKSAGNWDTLTAAKEYLGDYRTPCSATTMTISSDSTNSVDACKIDYDYLQKLASYATVEGCFTATNGACR